MPGVMECVLSVREVLVHNRRQSQESRSELGLRLSDRC